MKTFTKKRIPIRLRTWITLLVCLVLIVALTVTGILTARDAAVNARETQAEKTMDIAHTVSYSQIVRDGLQDAEAPGDIQEYTRRVQTETNVAYIVVMNMDHIRQSHPVEQRIGQYFVGNDENRAFRGEMYTSVAEGTLGESLRSFVPIEDEDGSQIGVVSVGILLDNVESVMMDRQQMVYIGSAVGLFVGTIGAVFLARRVKQTLHGLEPREIAQHLQEREAMLASVREGIIAINEDGTIVVANDAARGIFQRAGLMKNPMGQPVDSFFDSSRLKEVLRHQEAEYDQEQQLNGLDIVVNRIPVIAKGGVVGAIATFREKTELTSLVEQLTGARHYAETLRTQTHEFMNKLHVMSAMVHTESYEELNDYIQQISTNYKQEVGSVSRIVKDPVLAGYLLRKFSYFQENGGDVELDGDYPLPLLRDTEQMDGLITIIGNVTDNAWEAVQNQAHKQINLTINHIDSLLHFSVSDNGPGMSEADRQNMLQQGLSTKGENRGYGMQLTQKALQELNGTMDIFSEKGKGTTIKITIPYEGDQS
ncbi:two-component system sensor histidine kinase DcuS [Salibacterium salarium]|uniref:histidine kinase n=1 Tax=Salibacterium salarium TaxID=284579 RepID=A0A428N528_9BACI|nr:DcuS/MalK family sensor histidine kinase [Salibacterium salarium]RSL33580.1 two-component system sensor histidine kinase DcuS [Salibacterium salarium]